MAGQIGHAVLVFHHFASNGFLLNGSLGVAGYSGDTSIDLADYTRASTGVGNVGVPQQAVKTHALDVTSFLQSLSGPSAGFRFDLSGEGGADLLDDYYGAVGGYDFASSPAPVVMITAPVPLPAGFGFLVAALGMHGLLGRRRFEGSPV